jgi:hypothetical protein
VLHRQLREIVRDSAHSRASASQPQSYVPSFLPSLTGEQHCLIVLRTVEDPNDGNSVSFNTVDDQIAAKYAAADIFVLTARHKRESERIIRCLA